MSYEDFIISKAIETTPTGIEPAPEPHDSLFPFQRDLVRWALRRGRAAIFADTGLGKSRMQLDWARHVAAHSGRPVLVLAPLAVASQTVKEGEAIGIVVKLCRSAADVGPGVNVTNYDKLHLFDASAFGGVVLDESSILKSLDGKTRNLLISSFAATRFKLACTATPAPNDFTELGNHAEFLGVLKHSEMLATWFVHDGGSTQDWNLKGHAEEDFWRWVCSWGALVKRPSDLGYENAGYDLPALHVQDHVVPAGVGDALASGLLFAMPAATLVEQRAARRGTIDSRVEIAARMVAEEPSEPWVIWADLNDETDALEAAIPGAKQVRGSQSTEEKEEILRAFASGELRVLVSKASICGFGLNWQHCARMAFVGVGHSFESFYQAIRRCWRFGQAREVRCHVITSELEGAVVANLRRKEADAATLAEKMSARTKDLVRGAVQSSKREALNYVPAKRMKVPGWIERGAS